MPSAIGCLRKQSVGPVYVPDLMPPCTHDVDRPQVTFDPEGEIDALYRSDGERLWRAVYAFARDPDIASDAVAEAFAQCLARGDDVRSPKAWVWRTAFRIASGELQRRGRFSALNTEPRYDLVEQDDDLMSALASLPRNQRAALVLRYYAGYDAKGIAGILGCGTATARVHLSRGRKRMETLLRRTR
jgi:RNA polymerase sigma factor (sigma-70 family)